MFTQQLERRREYNDKAREAERLGKRMARVHGRPATAPDQSAILEISGVAVGKDDMPWFRDLKQRDHSV